MAAAQVLETPELLSSILHYYKEQDYDVDNKLRNCSTRKSLTKFARVNHLWFEAATDVLWSYEEWGPTLADLSRIEAARRQIYASKLVSIRLEDQASPIPDTTAVSFSKARRLENTSIGGKNGLLAWSVTQYPRPSIDSIYLVVRGNSFNKQLLDSMHSQCPRLRRLKLITRDEVHASITPKDFDKSFQGRSLETLYLDVVSALITKELFVTLGGMKNLCYLSVVGTCMSRRQIPKPLLDETVGVFEKLLVVSLAVERDTVGSVIMAIRHASMVKLIIISPKSQLHTPMFSNLRHMKNLFDLTLSFIGRDLCLDGEDLACLHTLEILESLSIEREKRYMGLNPTFENFEDSILEFIYGLSQLHTFRWQVCWLDITIDELSDLSHHCPNLKDVDSFGAWGLQALNLIPRRLFPNLRNLTLESSVEGGHEDMLPAKQIAKQIMCHAPDLQMLKINDDKSLRILKAWKKFKKQKENGIIIDFEKTIRPKPNMDDVFKEGYTTDIMRILQAQGLITESGARPKVSRSRGPSPD